MIVPVIPSQSQVSLAAFNLKLGQTPTSSWCQALAGLTWRQPGPEAASPFDDGAGNIDWLVLLISTVSLLVCAAFLAARLREWPRIKTTKHEFLVHILVLLAQQKVRPQWRAVWTQRPPFGCGKAAFCIYMLRPSDVVPFLSCSLSACVRMVPRLTPKIPDESSKCGCKWRQISQDLLIQPPMM